MQERCTIWKEYFEPRSKSQPSLSRKQTITQEMREGVRLVEESLMQCGGSWVLRRINAPSPWTPSSSCLTDMINSTSHSICEKSLKKIRTVCLCKLSKWWMKQVCACGKGVVRLLTYIYWLPHCSLPRCHSCVGRAERNQRGGSFS